MAFCGVQLQRNPRPAHAHRAKLESADVQNVKCDHVPFADFPQHVFHRNFAVIKNDGASRRSPNPHLVLFPANRESRESFLHQEPGELFSIHFGKNREQVGEPGVGDPHLLAVQNIMLAIFGKLRPSPAVQRVRS